jgi:hypothetical protein
VRCPMPWCGRPPRRRQASGRGRAWARKSNAGAADFSLIRGVATTGVRGVRRTPRGKQRRPTDGGDLLGGWRRLGLQVSPGDDASACALGAAGAVLCWGESYSPPGARGEAVRIPLGPPPASPDASVFDPPHAGPWEDINCQIHQPCEDVPAQLPRCPDGYEAKDWSQIEPWKLDGQTVTVRGPLVASRRLQRGGFAAILGTWRAPHCPGRRPAPGRVLRPRSVRRPPWPRSR